jgi:hypothetical protein
MKQSPHLVLIHGATASSNSFNYLLAQSNFQSIIAINYSSQKSFKYNLYEISNQIDKKLPCFVVAHSLGGIYAVHLSKTHNIYGAVTISTPYGGSEISTLMAWMMPRTQLYKDINPYSRCIYESKRILINVPWTQIITTRGHNLWSSAPNDGVVTIRSMNCRNDMNHIYLNYTHNEVMQAPEMVEIVNNRYKNL